MPLSLADHQLDAEQAEFRDTLRRFFEANAPIAEVRRVMFPGAGISPELWKKAGAELGLVGLAIGEDQGGQGFGLKELAIALSEVGRSLAPIPLFSSAALAGRVVAHVVEARGAAAGGAEGGEWLGALAAGQIATLAWLEDGSRWDPTGVRLVATRDGDAYRLSGVKRLVLDGGIAERIYVIARAAATGGDGLALFAVDAGSEGLSIEPQEPFDITRSLATVRFDDVRVRPVGRPGEDGAAIRCGLDEAVVLLCAEMVGGMQRVLETAVDYANARYQFGRPIGSFQAIKHKCADMLIDFEAGRTAVEAAVEALSSGDVESARLASVAKAWCGPAYVRMTIENMQIQGGVGYTWEYDAHLYYRRAQASEILLGAASEHHERIARGLAGAAAAGGASVAAGSAATRGAER